MSTYRRRLLAEDLGLLAALALVIAIRPGGALAAPLGVAIVSSLFWGYLTLHVPSRVETSAQGVAFSRYGRTHAFSWPDIHRVHVRRFLVGDRVLVRILPSSPWRGRYWLGDAHADQLRELTARAS